MNGQPRPMPLLGAIATAAVLLNLGTAHAAATMPAFGAFSKVGNGGVSGTQLAPYGTAADMVVNLAGTASWDDEDAPGNTVLTLNVIPGVAIDLISFSLTLSTVGESWLSEAAILITNSENNGVYFNPGGDLHPGTMAYSGSGSLTAAGVSFNAGADGKLYLQFYEDYDDLPNAADAFYTQGSITFGSVAAVPEPATYGLMALGLLGIGALVRRRT